ncbi:MAG: AAA family ATPase, partial [Deltaproteobacteria bacterium]|nr:AAA family ATPase [Deltaproteobacteria bacterium]
MGSFRNPFLYGGRVSGDAFWDREKEIRELLEDVRSRQHVILFSQRRYGKTSLVSRLLEEIRKERIIPVYVDLYPISTVADFIEEYGRAIARGLSNYEKAVKLIRDVFTRLHLTMGVQPDGSPQWGIGFDRNRETESLDEVVSCLEAYLARKGRYGVVVFDEFQQIAEIEGDKLERRLRTAIQAQGRISYLFVGSKKHLLYDMFNNPNRPFYRSGKIFPLGRIPQEDLRRAIQERFTEIKVSVEDEAFEKILETAECHPYYTQYLCHILCDISEGRKIRAASVSEAVDLLLRRESAAYMNTWDLLTQRQKQALIALSETSPGENPLRTDLLRRFNMSQPSVMLRALRSLVDKDLVDRED